MPESEATVSLTVDDVLRAVETLDEASGADSNHFRWRLRQWVKTQRLLEERKRLLADAPRD